MNNVMLVGRLGQDATLKTIGTDKTVTNFSIAVDTYGKTQWFNCRHWNADKLMPYMLKGKLVAINGELMNDSYEKAGQKHTVTYVNVRQLELLSKKGE